MIPFFNQSNGSPKGEGGQEQEQWEASPDELESMGLIPPKKRIAVIGVGSAGLLSLMHFCTWLDTSWEIVSIHNPDKKILGIGESTNGEFVGLLERSTRFNLGHPKDLEALDATIKYGSKFMDWRDQSWLNPLLDGNTAIHFNNFYLKDFVYERLQKHWPKQFRYIEGNVDGVENRDDRAVVTIDGKAHEFDYVIDCMGFPQDFTDYHISDCTPVNRCLIHSIHEFDYEPYTDHVALPHGWMFGVPLHSRKTFGYLFNDTISSKEEVQADMMRYLGVDKLDEKEYVFKCFYTEKLVDGRIFRNGNKALFFEPLVANSIFIYMYAVRCMYDYMMGVVNAEDTNAAFARSVRQLEDVISYYYQGGSTHNTPFWHYAEKMTRERLEGRVEFHAQMESYRTMKENGTLNMGPVYGYKPLTWEIVDEQMGYGYIDPSLAKSHPKVHQ